MALTQDDLKRIGHVVHAEVTEAVKREVPQAVKKEVTEAVKREVPQAVKKEVTEAVKREVFTAFSAIWEDHLEPNMFTKDEAKEMEARLMRDNQNTRDFIAKEAAKYSGASVQRDTTLNKKTNTVAEKLGAKSVFTADDVRQVARIAPVAAAPTE